MDGMKLGALRQLNLEHFGTESNPENLPLWVATAFYLTQDWRYYYWLDEYALLSYNPDTGKFDQRPGTPEATSHDQLTALAYFDPRIADCIVKGFGGICYQNDPTKPWWTRPFHPAHPIAYLGMSGSWWFWLWSPIWFVTVLVAFLSVWKDQTKLATDSRIYHWLQLDAMIRYWPVLRHFRSLLLWITRRFHPAFTHEADWIWWYHRKAMASEDHRNGTHPIQREIAQLLHPKRSDKLVDHQT